MKYCKDCKWVRPQPMFFLFWRWDFAKCANPELQPKRAPTGDEMVHPSLAPSLEAGMRYASTMRSFDDECGPDAKYWEPR